MGFYYTHSSVGGAREKSKCEMVLSIQEDPEIKAGHSMLSIRMIHTSGMPGSLGHGEEWSTNPMWKE